MRPALLAAVLLLAACEGSVAAAAQSTEVDEKIARDAEREYQPAVSVDPFTKATRTDMALVKGLYGDKVKCEMTKDIHPVLAVTLRRNDMLGQEPRLFVFTYYVASDWIFIESGAPLQVLAGDSGSIAPTASGALAWRGPQRRCSGDRRV